MVNIANTFTKGRNSNDAGTRCRALLLSGLRVLRPVLLMGIAAGTFAVLLRRHQGNFEKDLVQNFQRYQSDVVHSTARSIEGQFADVIKTMQVMGAYPEMRTKAPGARASEPSGRGNGWNVPRSRKCGSSMTSAGE